MDQPLGFAVGNALEIAESLEVLRGEGPADVRALTAELGGEMLRLSGREKDPAAARAAVERTLDSGEGLERFRKFVEAQEGDPRACDDPAALPAAPVVQDLPAGRAGWIASFDTRAVGLAANALGAGREQVGDPVDPAVGLLLRAKLGDRVERGDPLAQIHARTEDAAQEAARRLETAVRIDDAAPEPTPLVLRRPD